MNRSIAAILACALLVGVAGFGQTHGTTPGAYSVVKTTRVGGAGGWDYVNADEAGRRLYIARSGAGARITVFNLDTLAPEGELPNIAARGVAISAKSGHAFTTSKPVVMFDTKTLAELKRIDVEGRPDGSLWDPFNDRIYIFSHVAPNATVLDAKDGTVLGTIDLEGAPEQAVTDGKGHIYVAIEDKDNIAVVDAKTLKVLAHYDITGKGGTCAGLAMDTRNNLLFAACRNPRNMVVLNAADGKIITTLPLGAGTDGAAFNPKTMEVFSSQGDGTLTVIKENSPTSFEVSQTVNTMVSGKTMALDQKTGRILVIAGEFGPAPAPAPVQPGGRAGRGPLVDGSFAILTVAK